VLRRKEVRVIPATLLAFVLSSQAQVQTPAQPVPSITDAVFVSASFVELPLSRVTDSVSIITLGDLRARQTETVADALRAVPGLGVTMSG
jgi:outer membrane receptor for ferrienterochelin and colicin